MATITVNPSPVSYNVSFSGGFLSTSSAPQPFTASATGSNISWLSFDWATAHDANGDFGIAMRFRIESPSGGPQFSGKLKCYLVYYDASNMLDKNFARAANSNLIVTLGVSTNVGSGTMRIRL